MVDYATVFREGAVSPDTVASALRTLGEIADGRTDVLAVRHPLGFLCLPIERRAGCGVCVHVWVPGAGQHLTTSEIHAHSWDLLSVVLLGELQNEVFGVDERAPTRRVFEVHSRGDVDEMRATPRLVRCTTRSSSVHRAGETYRLEADHFHATHATKAVTVAFGRPRGGSLDRSLGDIDTGTHEVRRVRCDRADTVLAARAVARQL